MQPLWIGVQCLAAMLAGLTVLAAVKACTARSGPPRAARRPVPAMERIGRELHRTPVPARLRRRLDRPELGAALRQAALPWDSQQFVALQWLGLLAAGAGLASLVVLRPLDPVGGLMVMGVGAAGVFGPRLWLNLRAQRRQQEITLALPDLLDRLAFGLQAGLGFDVVLRRVSPSFPGPLGEELRRTIQGLDLGWRRDQAMDGLARNTGSQDVRTFVATVRQAEVLGTPLAEALRVQNELLRTARRRRAQEASRRLPVIILFPLVFFFLPALLIIYLAPPLLHFFLMR
jgi:pilus assembly protein TadC